jgi:hypothetical protein
LERVRGLVAVTQAQVERRQGPPATPDRYRPGEAEVEALTGSHRRDVGDRVKVPVCVVGSNLTFATKAATDPNADPKKLVDDGVAKANTILKENAPKR